MVFDPRLSDVRQPARISVGISDRQECNARLTLRRKSASITQSFTRPNFLDMGYSRTQAKNRPQVWPDRVRRQYIVNKSIECSAKTHHISPRSRMSYRRRRVGHIKPFRLVTGGTEIIARLFEPLDLQVCKFVLIRILGRWEMGQQAGHRKSTYGSKCMCKLRRFSMIDTYAPHAGIDLYVDAEVFSIPRRKLTKMLRGDLTKDDGREIVLRQQHFLSGPVRSKAQDRAFDPGLTKLNTFFRYCDTEPVDAFCLEPSGAGSGSVAVSIGLDDGHASYFFADELLGRVKIESEGIKVYVRLSWTPFGMRGHCEKEEELDLSVILQRNISVLLWWIRIPLVFQQSESPDQLWPCIFRLDDLVYKAALRRNIRVGEFFIELVYDAFAIFFGVRRVRKLLSIEYSNCAFRSHYGDLSGRIGEIDVRADVFRGHNTIGSAISFSGYHRDLRHGSFGKGVEEFCSVPDNSAVFLIDAGQKPRNILERDQRDIEAVAKTDETRRLYRSVDVENAREIGRLICNYRDRTAAQSREADHNIWRVMFLDFKEITFVDYRVNNVADVVRLVCRFGNNCIERVVRPVNRVVCRN